MQISSKTLLAILFNDVGSDELLTKIRTSKRKPLTSPLVRFEVVTALALGRAYPMEKPGHGDLALATSRFEELLKILGCSEAMITPAIGRLACELSSQRGLDITDSFSLALAEAHRTGLV